ncbi:uncharacterized protein CMU_007270 [Cryptosporidium muris RN66]|uniref:Uncharacterized protein n=1 Tax=Cryptosporidium muris (strain RN66) TaxID=441375 RepID=B6ADE7_CRYMR|nr:uncharacterized protein CMU_007270 [Cryptosporidium muris RN66]EEA06238.1 hypothetical protein, conserved [Cryptosporidium muris RN66]|eukprot:XP_002140587.1 hypothetical protein [Cryptosporidium muris RN66]
MRNVNFSPYSANISNIRNYIDSKLGNKLVSSSNTLKPNDEYTTRHNFGMDSAHYKVLQSPIQTNMCRSNTPFNTTKVTPFIREERRYQNSLLEKPIMAINRVNSDTYSVVKGNTPNFKYSHLDHSNFLNEKTLNIPSKYSSSKYNISEYYNGTINSGNSYSKFGKEPYGISTCRKRTLECMSNTDMKSATLNDESEEFYDAMSDNEYGDDDKVTSKINIQPPIKKPLHVLTPSTAYSSGQLGTKQNTLKGRSTTYGIPLSLVESDDTFFLESKNPERSLQSDISTPVSYINEVKYSHPDIISRNSILPPSALATSNINQRLRTPLRYRNTQILNKPGTCSRILTAAEMKQAFCRVRRPVGVLRDFTPTISDKSYADNKASEVDDSKITNSNYDKINAEILENSAMAEKSIMKNKHSINATIETKSEAADSDLATSSKLGDSENLSQIKNIFGKFINNKENDKALGELDNSSKEYRTNPSGLNMKDNDKKFGLDTDIKCPAKNTKVINSKSCEIIEEASKDINKEINKDTNSEINKGINKDIGKETTKENGKEINKEVNEVFKANKEDNEEAIKEVNKDIVPWWLANADKPNMVAIEEDSVFAPDSDSSDDTKNKDINDESKLPLPSLFKDNSSKSLQVNNTENTGQSKEVNTLHGVFENNSSGLESITKPSNRSIFCIGGTESSLQNGETKQLNANFIHQPSSSASIFSVNNGNSGNFANLPEAPKTIDLQSNSKNILTETQTNIFKNNLCTVSSKDSSASNLLNNDNLFSFSNTLNNSNELGQLIPNSSQSKDLDNSILSKPVSLFGATTQGITNTSDSLFSQLTKSPEKSGNLLSDAVSPQKDNSVTLFSSTQPSPFKSVSEFKDSNVTSNSSDSAKNLIFGDTFTKKPELNSTGSIFGTTSSSSSSSSSFIPFSSTTLNPVPSVGTNPSGSIFGSTSTTSQSSTVTPLSASGGLFGAQSTSGSATSLITNNSGNNGNSLTSTDNKTSGLFGPFSNSSFSSTNIGTSNTYLFGQSGASSPFGTSPIQNPPATNIFGSATQNISPGALGPNPILASNSNNPFIGHASNSNSATSHRRRIARAKRSQ